MKEETREMETCLYFERRQFLCPVINFASAGVISQATFCLLDPAVAEAIQGNPSEDIVAGVKQPKNLGGLPKKIRSVGNILVSFCTLGIFLFLTDLF